MDFRVKKELKWDGKVYSRGDFLSLPDGHPRIEGLMIGGFICSDACRPNPGEQQGIPVEKITKSRAKARRVGALA